jgi:hypothetical protein
MVPGSANLGTQGLHEGARTSAPDSKPMVIDYA